MFDNEDKQAPACLSSSGEPMNQQAHFDQKPKPRALAARSSSETYNCAVDAPLEAGFWDSICLARQDFVTVFTGAAFAQAGDHRLPCGKRRHAVSVPAFVTVFLLQNEREGDTGRECASGRS